jgi:REP element-mobilizing transposase RayT
LTSTTPSKDKEIAMDKDASTASPQPRPHSRDLRRGRYSEQHRAYLITTTTHHRAPLFLDWRCGRLVVRALQSESPRATTLAFVVMPDHLHWLMQLGSGASLAAVVQSVKSVSAHRVNRYRGTRGPVWQDGFHDHALRREEDLRATARYVVANPLRAGLIEEVGQWPLWDAFWLE